MSDSDLVRGEDHRLSHGSVRVVDVGDGPPLVLIHGLGGSRRNWLANLPGLTEHHRVIALDLPGFGRSERYAGKVTMERYVDTIIELLDLLGIERSTFVGNSMGGLLTIEAAARHPDRVSAAVLVSSGGIPLTSLRHQLITIPQARVMNRLLRLGVVRRAIKVNPHARRFVGATIVHDPATIPAQLLSAALNDLGAAGFAEALDAARRYDARVRAPLVTCPTLVVWGREDRLLPVTMASELCALIPEAQLVVWDHIGHCAMLEDPERFDALVTSFITPTGAGPWTGHAASPQNQG